MKRASPQRIEALTDGVFAIVMTLLVLELSIPVIAGTSAGTALSQRLLEMWPKYLGYLVSFLMLSLWWLSHHNLFEYVKRIDGRFLWLNLYFLMIVALIPFSTSLVAEYWGKQITAVIYGFNLLVPLILFQALWWYATTKHRLVDKDANVDFVKRDLKVALYIVLTFLVAMLLSFIDPIISYCIYGALTLFYIIIGWIGKEGLAARKIKSEEKPI